VDDKYAGKKAEIHAKMKGLLKEFSEGKISSEQFNIIYERYQNQLELLSMSESLVMTDDMNTIAIRKATQALAMGMGIYHHRSGTMIETLGNFDLPPGLISPTLNEFSDKLERREYVETRVQKGVAGIYLVYLARSVVTAVVVFKNEPSQAQLRDLERLLHDFEEANMRFLEGAVVDSSKLARPFIGFIKKKLGG
jgi:hypothetical protein